VSNVIDFLERVGADASLRYASGEAVDEALKLAGIDPGVRAAIASGDQGALEQLLGGRTNVCCVIFEPDEEEEEGEEEKEDEEEGEDEKEKDVMAHGRTVRRVG
jgi:hypothetical protein